MNPALPEPVTLHQVSLERYGMAPFDVRGFTEAQLLAYRADVIEMCAKACTARFMGDNNREDQEAKRCAAAIRSLK